MALEIGRIRPLLKLALREDLGAGDVTSEALVAPGEKARGRFIVKQSAVVAGLPVARAVFGLISPRVEFRALAREGAAVRRGRCIARVAGPARALLQGERLALNFLQRLSAIATVTRRCIAAVGPRPIRIMDTRKTTPCWRYLEKYAVRLGGGANHRMGLYDQVLIKDNHLQLARRDGRESRSAAQAVGWAVQRARARVGPKVAIEVEAATVEQALAAAEAGADIVMLDNIAARALRQAIRAIRRHPAGRRIEIEVSGNVRPANLAQVARAGPDRISLGWLTHSAPAVDISLEIE